MNEDNQNNNSNLNNSSNIVTNTPTENVSEAKKIESNLEKNVFNIRYTKILIYIVGGAVLIIVALLVFLLVYNKSNVTNNAYSGNILDDFLIYPNPEENGVIEYDLNNSFSVFVRIDKLKKVKGVGTKTYFSIYTVEDSDEITGQYVWLENDGSLKLHYSTIGNNFIFIDYSSNGYLLDFLDDSGNLTVIDNLDAYGGLYIKSYEINDDSIVLKVSRKDSESSIFYGDDNNSIYVCDINDKTVDNSMVISATYTYTLKDDKLNLDNPSIDDVVSFKNYYESNRSVYCQ